MEIRTLENTSPAEITTCFNAAFAGYFVPITATEEALKNRWRSSRVNLNLSVGAFENGKLVSFIFTGIDNWQGKKTAYNAGTGVLPEFRGRKLVSELYDFAFPLFRKNNIEQCTLEVITENAKAIKAYQNVGFQIARTLHCYKGEIKPAETENTFDHKIPTVFDLEELTALQPFSFSWDNCNASIAANPEVYECHQLLENGHLKAYALLNPANSYLAQIGYDKTAAETYGLALLREISKTNPALRINNVAAEAPETIHLLTSAGLENHVSQYEMHMLLN